MKKKICSIFLVVFMITTLTSGYSPMRAVMAEERVDVSIINPSFEEEATFDTGNTATGWAVLNSNPARPVRIHSDEITEAEYGVEAAFDGNYAVKLAENSSVNQAITVEENSVYELTFYHTKTATLINACLGAKWDGSSWSLDGYNSGYQNYSTGNQLEREAYSLDLGNGWYKRVIRIKVGEGLDKVLLFTRGSKSDITGGYYLLDNFILEKVVPEEETGLMNDPSFEASFLRDMNVNAGSRGWVNPNSNNNNMKSVMVVEEGQLGGLSIPDGKRAMSIDVSYDSVLISNRFNTDAGEYYKLSFCSSKHLRDKTQDPGHGNGFVESACRTFNNDGSLCATGLCSGANDSGMTHKKASGSSQRKYDSDVGNDTALQCIPLSGELEGWYQYTVYFKALEAVSQFYLPLLKNTDLTGGEKYLYLDDFKLEKIDEIPPNKRVPNNSFEEPLLTGGGVSYMFKWTLKNSPVLVNAETLAGESLGVPDGNNVLRISDNSYPYINSPELIRVKPGTSYILTYYSASEITTPYDHGTDSRSTLTGYLSISPYSNKGIGGSQQPDDYRPNEDNMVNMTKTQEMLDGDLTGWYLNTIEFTTPTLYPVGTANNGSIIDNERLIVSGMGVNTYIDNIQLVEKRTEEALTFTPEIDKINSMKPFNVTINNIPEGASVHYTENGNEPGDETDETTKLYNEVDGIDIDYGETKQIKAIVLKEGIEYSGTVYESPQYSVLQQLTAPILPDSQLNANAPIEISLTPESGTKIYYTLNGDVPDSSSSVYDVEHPIVLSYGYNGTVKVIAISDDASKADSEITAVQYSVKEINIAPVLPELEPWQDSPITITIPMVSYADVYFTVNGEDPYKNDTMKYTEPFILPYGYNGTVKTIAITADGTRVNSPINSKAYSVKAKTPTPVFDPLPGTGKADAPIEITIAEIEGAAIYYNTNGDPLDGGIEYTGDPIILPYGYDGTVKAVAVPNDTSNYVNSDVAAVGYSVKAKPLTPVFDPLPGTGKADAPVEITILNNNTENVSIFYTTTDGDLPEDGIEYTGDPIILPYGYNGTVKAIAVPSDTENYVNSDIVSVAYGVKSKMTAPVLPTSVTEADAPIEITIAEIEGAAIYYNTNGNPLDGGIEYTGDPIILPYGYDGTVKAIAVPDDTSNYVNSDITAVEYSVKPKLENVEFEPNGGQIIIQTGKKGLVKIKNIPGNAQAYYALYDKEPAEEYVEESWIAYDDSGIELDAGRHYISAYMIRDGYVDSDVTGALFNVVNKNLADAAEQAKTSVITEFEKFDLNDYTEENRNLLIQIKENGLAALELCSSEEEVAELLQELINALNAVERIAVPTVTLEPTASQVPTATLEPTGTIAPTETVTPTINKPKSVKLNRKKVTLKVKKSVKLKATLKPKKVSAGWKKLIWKSKKPKIAKVSKKGKVTAKKPGKATIIVKTRNNKKAKCIVKVKK